MPTLDYSSKKPVPSDQPSSGVISMLAAIIQIPWSGSANIKSAMANSTGFTEDQLQDESKQLGQFGTLQSVTFSSFYISTMSGYMQMELGGGAKFTNATKSCRFRLRKFGDSYTVTSYWIR